MGARRNSLNYQLQQEQLFRANSGVSSLPLLFPSAVQADYVPWFVFRGDNATGRTGNAGQYQTDRGPFTNENITHDVIANLTKVWGAHSSKFGFYYQSSFKPQSIFASFNSQINFVDNSSNPFDTGFGYANAATGVFNFYQQASKFALPEWRYKNIEWYAQDNWKPTDRLTLDYGVRFYALTPQWDTTLQASNFLPDKFDRECGRETLYAGVRRRRAGRGLRAARDGPDADRRRDGPDLGQYRRRALHRPAHARLESLQRQLPGGQWDHRSAPGREYLPRLAAHRRGLRLDGSGRDDRPRRLRDLLRPAAGQHGLRHDLQRAGRPELEARLGTAAESDVGERRSLPDAVAQSDRVRLQAAARRPVEPRRSAQAVEEVILDVAYVGSRSTDLLRQVQINALPIGAKFLPQNQDPTRVPSATPGATALPNDFLRPYRGYGNIRMWDYSGYANYKALQTSVTRRFDRGFMFSGFWVWSKAQGINNNDFAAGVPNLSDEETRRLDYSLLDYDRTHNFMINAIYQTPRVTSSKGWAAGERLAAVRRLPMDERPALHGQLLDSRHRRREPDRNRRQSERARRPDLRPGSRLERRSVHSARSRRASRRRSRAARATNRHGSSSASTDQQSRPVGVEEFPARAQRRGSRSDSTCSTRWNRPVHRNQQYGELRQPDGSDDHQPAVRRAGEPDATERIRNYQGRRPPRTLQLVTRVTF